MTTENEDKPKNDVDKISGYKKIFRDKWKEMAMKLQVDIEPEDLLAFDKMIALPAIKILYWLGLICIPVTGLAFIFQGGFNDVLIGLSLMVGGVVVWRITCEAAILLFGIYDRLGDIRNAMLKENKTTKK
ncbi:MAG: DUF4282 domain-containing protein [Alphaproteobacteria bacterium]|nr:DUF4282 domain-containing protein [Alphaproteobacteria bacterium]